MPGLDTIFLLLEHYGYLLLFFIAVIEGPIITVIAAFLASQGYFNVFAVYGVVIMSDLAGDLIYYTIGHSGKGALLRWGKYIRVKPAQIAALEKQYQTSGGKMILFGKFTHSAGFAILIAAGTVGMPIIEFLWYNLVGSIPKSLTLVLIGYYVGENYVLIDSYLGKASLIAFVFICAVGYYVYLRKRSSNAKNF